MAIRRETDTKLIDKIANSPAVRPFVVYHDHECDWTPAIEHCVVLSNGEDAIGIFERTPNLHEIYQRYRWGLRLYQGHTLFDETCRGKKAIQTGREMLAHILENYGDVIWGATPMKNARARWFNRQLGMKSIGFDEYEVEGPVEIFAIEVA